MSGPRQDYRAWRAAEGDVTLEGERKVYLHLPGIDHGVGVSEAQAFARSIYAETSVRGERKAVTAADLDQVENDLRAFAECQCTESVECDYCYALRVFGAVRARIAELEAEVAEARERLNMYYPLGDKALQGMIEHLLTHPEKDIVESFAEADGESCTVAITRGHESAADVVKRVKAERDEARAEVAQMRGPVLAAFYEGAKAERERGAKTLQSMWDASDAKAALDAGKAPTA